jgi:cytochrome P450
MDAAVAVLPEAPQVPGWPVLGHLPMVRREGILGLIDRSWHALGDVFSVDIGFHAIAVAHPEAIKWVLAGNAKNYVKGRTYDGVRRVIGNGVLALEGDAWKSRRTLIQPAFHRAALGKLTQAMVECGRAHFDALLEKAPLTLDVHRDMVKLTLDVVTATLFGRELLGAANISYDAMTAALELVSERGNGFLLPQWVPTPANRKFARTMAEVEGVIYRIIEAGRRRDDASDGTLLSMLLHSTDAETGQRLSDRDVRDEIFTMIIAGHETTALTLTWMFTLLHDRRDVIDAMVAEVDSVLGSSDPTFEDVPKLKYVRQVIDETLRLRGPVAMTARSAVDDDEIAGVKVRSGDVVMPYFYGAHRHPAFWSDPERFDPDRFSAERAKGRNPWSYVPFAAGQRQCIGNMFSLVETAVLLAQLFRRLHVEVDPSVRQVKPVASVTVRPDRPVRAHLSAR